MIRTTIAAGALAALLVVPLPAVAQEQHGGYLDLDAMKRQLDRAWDRLAEDLEPALKRVDEVIAVLREVDDPRHYEAPMLLPNGDIVIRRRADAPPWQPPEDERQALPDSVDPDEGVRL
ncbi:MAG: hypothetical protein AAF416_14185 [Pseudomonadota bacterium]